MKVYTQNNLLAGAQYLAVAASGVRIVASCESSSRLVMLGIASMDSFPVVGYTDELTDAPEALVVDETAGTIFVLCGKTLRTFSTAATPVPGSTVQRHDDNNRWIALAGTNFVIYPDGNIFVIAARNTLVASDRLNTSVGRCGLGLYDSVTGHLYIFSESTNDVDIFAVDTSDGTAIPVGHFQAVGLNPVHQGVIVSGVMYLITHDSHRLSSYDLADPTVPVLLDSTRFTLGPFNTIDDISDLAGKFLITDDQFIPGSSDRFDWTPDRFGMYHAGRGFVAHGNTGRVSADTVLYAFNDNTGEFERVEPNIPTVYAGLDQNVAFGTATLVGSAYGPNSGSLTFAWSKVSGPGTVSFSAGTSLTTNVTVSVQGQYVFRLTGTYGSIVVMDEVVVALIGISDINHTVPPGFHYVTLPYPVAITLVSAPTADNPHTVVFTAPSGASIFSGATLIFTSANWNIPQYVYVIGDSPAATKTYLYTVTALHATINGSFDVDFTEAPRVPFISQFDENFEIITEAATVNFDEITTFDSAPLRVVTIDTVP